MEIKLGSYMLKDQWYQFSRSYIKTDSMTYYLTHEQPYSLVTEVKTDSLIKGSFWGTFINKPNSDTLEVKNGYFIIHPFFWNDYYFSLEINDNFYSTRIGREYFERNGHMIMTVDTTFQDTLIAYFSLYLYTLSDNFIKDFYVWPNDKSVTSFFSVHSKISDFNSSYDIESGVVSINSIDYYEHEGEILERIGNATFELEAKNDKDEIIKIENGNISITGF
jgi:hypothetical protein